MAEDQFVSRERAQGDPKVGFMDVTSATNARTFIACACRTFPLATGSILVSHGWKYFQYSLACRCCNSLCFDFVQGNDTGGLHLNWFIVSELPIPVLASSVERFTDKRSGWLSTPLD